MRERHPSPFLRKKASARPDSDKPEDYAIICSREKIHRIRCRRNYHAQVVNVVSPSEIWVRPINHIANKLSISTSTPNMAATDLKEGAYVLAPLDEEILVRARILEYLPEEKRALVRFIDHGDIGWRDAKVLFETKSKREVVSTHDLKHGREVLAQNGAGLLMKARVIEYSPDEKRVLLHGLQDDYTWRDETDVYELIPRRDELRCYPWQTIPIMLQGIKPRNNKNWTLEEVTTLKETLSAFPYVYVLPTIHDNFVINDDDLHVPASLQGLHKGDLKNFKGDMKPGEELGESIAFLYELNLPYSPLDHEIYNAYAFTQREYPFPDLITSYPAKYQSFNIQAISMEDANLKSNEVKILAAALFESHIKEKEDKENFENELSEVEDEDDAENEVNQVPEADN